MADDGFARSVEAIDRDLHDAVQRRENGIAEILHGCFLAERADRTIERLIDERCKAQQRETQPA